jgi:hypothetical protein
MAFRLLDDECVHGSVLYGAQSLLGLFHQLPTALDFRCVAVHKGLIEIRTSQF